MKKQAMTNGTTNVNHSLRLSSFCILLFLCVGAVLFSACTSQNTGITNGSSTSTTTASQNTASSTPTVGPSATTSGGHPVKVYFSKLDSPNSDDVFPVQRTSPTEEVATFAVEQLVAGPTQDEQNQGLVSEIHDAINGPSNCSGQNAVGGSDFLLTLNKKGSVSEQGTATLQFCRDITRTGIGRDARIQAEVTATLKQFTTIQKVVILSKDGNCFQDASGANMCLN